MSLEMLADCLDRIRSYPRCSTMWLDMSMGRKLTETPAGLVSIQGAPGGGKGLMGAGGKGLLSRPAGLSRSRRPLCCCPIFSPNISCLQLPADSGSAGMLTLWLFPLQVKEA